MRRFFAPAIAAIFAGSSLAIAEPASDNATLVVVLEKPSGVRQTHSQSSTSDSCHAMLQRFKELNEKRQPLMLDTLGGSAEALAVFCIEANGEGVDWKGAALTSEQIQQRTDELITERKK
jgi:hypothetical protein